jgi:hypothetical protein
VEKQARVITIVNETTGQGRAFGVRTASVETLARAVREVAEQQLVANSAEDGVPDAKG